MLNIWKRSSHPKAETYQFPDTEELEPKEQETEEVPLPQMEEPEQGPPEEPPASAAPLQYAQVQADQMLLEAKRQAEKILGDARQEAQRHAEMLYEDARRNGWETGHAEGVSQGSAQALEENRRVCEEKIKALSEEVAQFLERANAALDRQMDENIGELRELAIAVAEKVIAVSLRSSSEVIGRMIQAAVDKRKRREWVRIHIAECDAKRMARLSPALTAALASLSSVLPRPARYACLPASMASLNAPAIAGTLPAVAMAVLAMMAAAPISMASQACEGRPIPASTIMGRSISLIRI